LKDEIENRQTLIKELAKKIINQKNKDSIEKKKTNCNSMTKLKTFKTFIIEPRVKINNKKLKTFSKKEKIRKTKKDLQQQTDHHSPPYKEEDTMTLLSTL